MINTSIEFRLRGLLLPRRAPKLLEWACQNVIIPDGPRKGELFDPDVQPFARVYYEAIDSGQFDRIVATGPSQTGKSLICYVIPVCYHLFGIGETVVAGLPTGDMADDKWREDILPVIEASPTMRALLPNTGPGSRAGRVRTRVKFLNGATLRFMTGGGSDKQRAAFTSRVLAITEVDGMNAPGKGSVEADKIKQLEARQRAYLATGIRTYLECTVSETRGRIWQEYLGGTESRLARPCPHCRHFVTPERKHLIGWSGAESEKQARNNSSWSCPECGECWTEAERYAANLKSVLVHRGQEIDKLGNVTGEAPETSTLGFRWTAADNHFATAGDVGVDEWNGEREGDRDNAERELCQFVHCVPYDPPLMELTPLDPVEVRERKSDLPRGVLPSDLVDLVVTVDTGKRALHWESRALRATGAMPVVDYGIQPVEADRLGVYRGLIEAFALLHKYIESAWNRPPAQVWIDSGYHEHTDAVYDFCRRLNAGQPDEKARYRPMKGYGEGQRNMTRYVAPDGKRRDADVRYIGKEFHISRVRRNGQALPGVLLVHINSDHWKSEFHQGLALPLDQPGAIALFKSASPLEHADWAAMATAEKQVEKYIRGQGIVIKWERENRKNHFIDTGYIATACCSYVAAMRDPLRASRGGERVRVSLSALAGRR